MINASVQHWFPINWMIHVQCNIDLPSIERFIWQCNINLPWIEWFMYQCNIDLIERLKCQCNIDLPSNEPLIRQCDIGLKWLTDGLTHWLHNTLRFDKSQVRAYKKHLDYIQKAFGWKKLAPNGMKSLEAPLSVSFKWVLIKKGRPFCLPLPMIFKRRFQFSFYINTKLR